MASGMVAMSGQYVIISSRVKTNLLLLRASIGTVLKVVELFYCRAQVGCSGQLC